MIKILHINSTYGRAGAALSMAQLSDALNGTGDFQSNIIVGRIVGKADNEHVTQLGADHEYYINAFINRVTGFDSVWYPFDHTRKLEAIISKYDIIHLHNLHGYYFKLKYLKLLRNKKVVWTIRDYWPITGRCCYPLDCKKWANGCGHCPHLDYYPGSLLFDGTSKNYNLKQEAINSIDNLYAVAISNSAKELIKRGKLRYKTLNVICNGLDDSIYYPSENCGLIRINNARQKRKVLILASKIVKRKGSRILNDMFASIPEEMRGKYHFIVIGDIDRSVFEKSTKGISVNYLGYINDINVIKAAYSAADLYVNPSLSETFGRTTIESMLCGTPVIALKTDIMEEIISNEDLLVTSDGDIGRGMVGKMNKYFNDLAHLPEYSTANVRERALRFSFNIMLNKYITLYKKVHKNIE